MRSSSFSFAFVPSTVVTDSPRTPNPSVSCQLGLACLFPVSLPCSLSVQTKHASMTLGSRGTTHASHQHLRFLKGALVSWLLVLRLSAQGNSDFKLFEKRRFMLCFRSKERWDRNASIRVNHYGVYWKRYDMAGGEFPLLPPKMTSTRS